MLIVQFGAGSYADQHLTAQQGSGVNGIDTAHLLSVLEHTAQLLKDMGAPAREAAAVAAHAAIRTELSSALQAGDSPALAAAVVKAVRVLMAQLKMLRMDAANFRLKMLAHSLKDGAGIRFVPPHLNACMLLLVSVPHFVAVTTCTIPFHCVLVASVCCFYHYLTLF